MSGVQWTGLLTGHSLQSSVGVVRYGADYLEFFSAYCYWYFKLVLCNASAVEGKLDDTLLCIVRV